MLRPFAPYLLSGFALQETNIWSCKPHTIPIVHLQFLSFSRFHVLCVTCSRGWQLLLMMLATSCPQFAVYMSAWRYFFFLLAFCSALGLINTDKAKTFVIIWQKPLLEVLTLCSYLKPIVNDVLVIGFAFTSSIQGLLGLGTLTPVDVTCFLWMPDSNVLRYPSRILNKHT